jgi:hypothetical protein
VSDVSADTRLDAAYRAIMQAALVAMLANGYRPVSSEAGHHQVLIQALPKTAGIDPDLVRILDAYRAARNQSDCGGKAEKNPPAGGFEGGGDGTNSVAGAGS